ASTSVPTTRRNSCCGTTKWSPLSPTRSTNSAPIQRSHRRPRHCSGARYRTRSDPMRVVRDFPEQIRQEEQLWIPVRDGTRLAARVWRPLSSDADPVPAVLEMIPYRQHDLTSYRDSIHHPYLAGHGYACLRVDLRGSGDSEGVL